MRIGIVGGTGKLGSGLAIRWARAGHTIALGSRDPARARDRAAQLAGDGHAVEGGDNAWAAREGEVVVLTVPYEAHEDTLRSIVEAVAGKVLVDVTVPLKPPKVSRVQLPAGLAAALEAQALLGPSTPVAATLHHVSATHLADPSHRLECDVLVAADDPRAKSAALGLVRDLGLRALDAGPLVNAIALESLTPVLIHLNRTYKSQGAGIVFTDLPGADQR
jgi:8-hydroxy-5-deazaflavin:NADPH oxidoreductase